MIWVAVICFAVAALGGVVMEQMMIMGRKQPLSLAVVHAGLAVAGLVLFILSVWPLSSAVMWAILIAFVLAAAVGLILLRMLLQGKWRHPLPLVEVHGVFALVGFVMLVMLAAGAAH